MFGGCRYSSLRSIIGRIKFVLPSKQNLGNNVRLRILKPCLKSVVEEGISVSLVLENVKVAEVHNQSITPHRCSKLLKLLFIKSPYVQVLPKVNFLSKPFLLVKSTQAVPKAAQILVSIHTFLSQQFECLVVLQAAEAPNASCDSFDDSSLEEQEWDADQNENGVVKAFSEVKCLMPSVFDFSSVLFDVGYVIEEDLPVAKVPI